MEHICGLKVGLVGGQSKFGSIRFGDPASRSVSPGCRTRYRLVPRGTRRRSGAGPGLDGAVNLDAGPLRRPAHPKRPRSPHGAAFWFHVEHVGSLRASAWRMRQRSWRPALQVIRPLRSGIAKLRHGNRAWPRVEHMDGSRKAPPPPVLKVATTAVNLRGGALPVWRSTRLANSSEKPRELAHAC